MSLAEYFDTVESGIDWLGDIPQHWEVVRLRHVAELNPSKSEVAGLDRELPVSFLPMEAIGDDGSISLGQTRPIGAVENGYTYFRDGDVTLAKITPCFENGKGAIMRGLLNGVGFGTTELIVARPIPKRIISDYLHWLFLSTYFRRIGESTMYGAGGQKRVPDDFVRNFSVAIPSPDEQKAIASFLDTETSKIDALVSEQRRLIELLKEKRQAVISHAVTKGLDPSVPMKDSGIEWLGDVPEHWEVMSLRRVVSKFVDYRGKTPARSETGIPLVTASAVRDGEVDHSRSPKYVTQETYDEWMVRGFPEVGDVVFTTEGATFGETGQIVDASVALAQRLILFKVDVDTITNNFLYYHFLSDFGQAEQWSNTTGTTVFGVRASKLKATTVVIPPLSEQVEIERYIKDETCMFGDAEAQAERAIELLQERRTALISAAVTGKIDVREIAYQETA